MDRFWHLCYQFAIGPLEIDDVYHIFLQDGAPKIAKLPYKWLYGRYNYS